MAAISTRRIRSSFEHAFSSSTRTEQGRALEDLICYVFRKVPGIQVVKRNELNAFDTEEIDVAFWNARLRDGLPFLPHVLLVECKNWTGPVGSQEVSYFAQRLGHRGADHGILIAANGITGKPQDLKRAHYEIAMALAAGQRILVLTRTELESLSTTQQLVRLLKEKLCELTVSGTLFL